MNELIIQVALIAIIILLLVLVVLQARKPIKRIKYEAIPSIYTCEKLSDVPDFLKISGSLVYTTMGLGSKGMWIHDGTEFIKVENKVCPICGK